MNTTKDHAPAKILIVDDSPSNIHILMETLKGDYAIVAATNGEKALCLAESETPPDLILLDVLMPGINGHEVCNVLKSNAKTREIPVIFVTALGQEEDEQAGLNLGAIDYIQKPFSQSIVRARVRNHIELVRVRKQLQKQNQALLEATKLREDVERMTQHDMKGPLSAVTAIPELLLKDNNLTADQKEMLSIISEAGYRLLEMINLSLDLYKMETGCYPFQPKEIDLLPIFHKIITENHKSFPNLDIQLTVESPYSAQTFFIWGEELLCYSMFSNLARNALEAAPSHTTVRITLYHKARRAEISIRNQGEVPLAIRSRFFEKYVTAGKKKGTGLGTYSAYLIAQTQRGGIDLDSSEAGATTITVWLPYGHKEK